MPKVTLRHERESFESLMRRFKKAVEKSDLLKDLREYEFFEKPSERKKREKAAAVKRWQRKVMESDFRNLGKFRSVSQDNDEE